MKFAAITVFVLLLTGVLLIPGGVFAQETNQTDNGGEESVGVKDQLSVIINSGTNGTQKGSIATEDELAVNKTSSQETTEQDVSNIVHEAILLFKQQRDETINAIKECRENIQNASPENRQQVRDDCRTNLNDIKEFYKEIRDQIRELIQENRDTVKALIKETKTSLTGENMVTHDESNHEDDTSSDHEDNKKQN
jgi:hypothetical protein